MIKAEKFKTFGEYETYLNDVQHFWTLLYELFPELKQLSGKSCQFTIMVISFVNNYGSLKQQIRALEHLKQHNTEEYREKYIRMLEKISDIELDFY
jgi:hypothetical protein